MKSKVLWCCFFILLNAHSKSRDFNLESKDLGSKLARDRFFCYSACNLPNGKPNLFLLSSGYGKFKNEAELKAFKNLIWQHNCKYGEQLVRCDSQEIDPSHFCVSSCRHPNGQLNFSESDGSRGHSKAEAQFFALQYVGKTWNCKYGMGLNSCDQKTGPKMTFCYASCNEANGNPDLKNISGKQGEFANEAKLLAAKYLTKNHNCSHGLQIVKCGLQSFTETNYCVSSCKTPSGKPDPVFSAGSSGRSVAEAQMKSLKLVKKNWKCDFGVTVKNCR